MLEFDRDMTVWRFVSYLSGEKTDDKVAAAVVAFLDRQRTFEGTASELLDELKKIDRSLATSPNGLARSLKEQYLAVEKRHHITIGFRRTNYARFVSLSVGDGDDINTYRGTPDLSSLESAHH
ncbi:MAG: hypothetical protein ACRDBM_13855 [Sporomusa sp.]